MTHWQSYTNRGRPHTVVGDLRVWRSLRSPQFGNHRDILVWLPPNYDSSDAHYPVLYMHDGQNLFDAHTSFSGEWQVDETMLMLCAEGREAIIVAVPNKGEMRPIEYNPYPSGFPNELPGRGDEYIDFLVDTVKPLIDGSFRTRPEAAMTGIAGSSMGGLISLYGLFTRPDVFGWCGAFSTAFWFGMGGLYETLTKNAGVHGKVYLDVGTNEGATFGNRVKDWDLQTDDFDFYYVQEVRRLRDDLLAQGYQAGVNLIYVEEEGAVHNEAAWARRLPNALRFLLP